jgi:hypothetical protein
MAKAKEPRKKTTWRKIMQAVSDGALVLKVVLDVLELLEHLP